MKQITRIVHDLVHKENVKNRQNSKDKLDWLTLFLGPRCQSLDGFQLEKLFMFLEWCRKDNDCKDFVKQIQKCKKFPSYFIKPIKVEM